MDTPRIAWLLNSAFYYWHPPMASFTKHFPQTQVFTSLWPGFAPGLEAAFQVEVVGERKVVAIEQSQTGYGNHFTVLPLGIVKRLLQFRPAVVFSNSFGLWTILALLFKPLGRWRVVLAYEGSSPSVDFRDSPTRLTIRKAMVKMTDACITNSHAGKAYLTEILNAAEDHVFVQPYEVPAIGALMGQSIEQKPNLHTPVQKPCFLYVGQIVPRKGLQHLLAACVKLQQSGYSNYTLQIVGSGSQQSELEAFCQTHGLTNIVKWVGRVDYGCLGSYFQQADVFVLPTLEDTWGMVILEAMVFGKAMLCSQLAGAAELILDGKNGYTFDPENPDQLAQLMQRFITQPELATAMGQQSIEQMHNYTPDTAGQFLAKVTHFVLDR
jgi:glycosyltransferase involved in cell wall biosynthesis